jgi:DnaK suppressor protein
MSAKSAALAAKGQKKDSAEKVRKRLFQKREELLHDLAKNREVSEETVDESAQDMADRATSAYTKEFAYSLSESDRKVLLLIDQALERLEAGTYGVCVHCSSPCQEKRLEAVPWARHCLDCQELQDKGLI